MIVAGDLFNVSISTEGGFFQKAAAALGSKVFRHWVVACVAGQFLAQFLVGLVAALLVVVPSREGWDVAFAIATGLGFAVPQWVVLRRHFKKAYGWIVATALGSLVTVFLIAWVAKPMLATFSDPSVWGIAPLFQRGLAETIASAVCYGASIGTAQWLFFRTRQVEHAVTWIVVTMIAAVLIYLLPRPDLSAFIQRVDGSMPLLYTVIDIALKNVQGIIRGCLTGYVLMALLPQGDRLATIDSAVDEVA